MGSAGKLFCVLSQGLCQCLRLRTGLFSFALGGVVLYIFPQYARSAVGKGNKGLRRRQDAALPGAFGAPLVGYVEKTHGVHVVAPEFYSHGLLVGWGEKVQYAAPAGKLARALHLLGAGIAAAHQRVLGVLNGNGPAGLDDGAGLQKGLGRQGALQKSRRGDNHRVRFASCQRVQGLQPLLFSLPGGSLRRIEGKIPACQNGHGLMKHGAKISCHALRGGFVGAYDHQRPAAFFAQRRGQICPVDG